MDIQDDYSTGFSKGDGSAIVIKSEKNPCIKKGLLPTNHSAILPKGTYIHLATSLGRRFYLAPSGFEYSVGTKVKSQIGGVVQIEAGSLEKFYVWYLPNTVTHSPSHNWTKGVKPGLLNMLSRPWVEGDLKVKLDIEATQFMKLLSIDDLNN